MTRVLVVDDDSEIRHTVRFLLEDAGHDVLEAADGHAALATLRQSPDALVVLLDILMPGLDGIGVLRHAHAEPPLARRHAYIVMTAGNQGMVSTAASLAESLTATVITKPFDIDQLLEQVDQMARRLRPDA